MTQDDGQVQAFGTKMDEVFPAPVGAHTSKCGPVAGANSSPVVGSV